MKKLLLVALVLALPSISYADEKVISTSESVSAQSFLGFDIHFLRAHTCQTASFTCGPDNVVTSPFAVLFQVSLVTTQAYTRIVVITDIEGSVVDVVSFAPFVIPNGTTTTTVAPFTEAGSGSVVTRGLYKLQVILIGADGKAAFSDPFRFRVLP